MDTQTIEQGFQQIWDLFKETDRKFQETDRQFKEIELQFKETDRKFQETDRKFQETDRKFQESAEHLRKIEEMFISRWGRFMEVLVNSGALLALRDYGVPVDYSAKNVSEQKTNGLGRGMEIDVLCWGKEIVVPLEVKTTLKIEYVIEHEERLRRFAECFPKFAGMTLYGGIAALHFDEEADRYAYRRGFYVLTLVGENMVKVLNDQKFRPKEWS